MRRGKWSRAWLWAEVALCLVGLDLLLLRAGLLWRVSPDFGNTLVSVQWLNLYEIARLFESRSPSPATALTVGSSVVWTGVDARSINRTLGADRVPAEMVPVTAFGLSTIDVAILSAAGLRLDPWLVIYGATVRDFRRQSYTDTPTTRLFYDASMEVPALPRTDMEERLDAEVKRWWGLYRYRLLVRAALAGVGDRLLGRGPRLAGAAAPPPSLSPEALQRFDPSRVTPESYAVWERWRASRRFADYVDWLNATGGHVLEEYQRQTLANFGPEGNPEVPALDWMFATLASRHVRGVLVYFPENPAFHDPEAAPYWDAQLSAAYRATFARVAAAHGARFVDLRDLLDAEDFYDLIHPNLEGMRKISARLAAVVEEEWQARAR